MQLLRQPQNNPFKLHEQVIMLVSATAHVMQDVPVDDIGRFRNELLKHFHSEESTLCKKIDDTGVLSDDDKEEIVKVSEKFKDEFLNS